MSLSFPLVSVLMTAYNREKYIADAIESVLASTFQDFELIIVDDCSTDDTIAIARGYEAKDSRIRVYVNERNLGDYPNRNRAASYAKGKYLKYLDSDDLIYAHGLQVMVESMEKYPEAALGTQYNEREDKLPYPHIISSVAAFREHFLGNGFFLSGPTGTIFKRNCFQYVGGFSGIRFIGDTELWFKLGALAPIVKFQPALIWWRKHEEQEMASEVKAYEEGIILRYKLNRDFLSSDSCPLTNRDKCNALRRLKKHYLIKIVISFFKYKSPKMVFSFFKQFAS